MGEEPRVDAVDVEGMAALRKKAELFLGVELAEADGAVEGVFRSGDVLVEEDRQRVDEGLVNAGVVEVEELLELTFESGGAVEVILFSVGPSDEVADEEMEETGDGEDRSEDNGDEEDRRTYFTDEGVKRRRRGERDGVHVVSEGHEEEEREREGRSPFMESWR